ncbi:MerR family transcriptional regulator [Variovorax sp. PCZ-1]|uniref:MerR family transcriptional regulator n=1 Tax=Variovorax sp. PCZ-1 TaxID=2835533 RepID=UPI001BCB62FE|nr:MerR family transcriptional regulator [Variovorax sp. PCZ-1]MBS7807138.1 MerR family transcriptional regulator [Variovorax sp. PCZ-1]
MEKTLPPLPAKRYFTIGEVSELCDVKPHVLRYWEQEFAQLKPMKRRGNRRYYQHHEVLMIRRIRDLLYDQGFTISGARNKLHELIQAERDKRKAGEVMLDGVDEFADDSDSEFAASDFDAAEAQEASNEPGIDFGADNTIHVPLRQLRRELFEIRELLAA